MFPNLILADLLVESDFLEWPLSKEFYGNRYANNLTRIKVDEDWTGKSITYEGEKYKTYREWMHFASDYSDILCFTNAYDSLLKCPSYEIQLKYLADYKENTQEYLNKVNELKSFTLL